MRFLMLILCLVAVVSAQPGNNLNILRPFLELERILANATGLDKLQIPGFGINILPLNPGQLQQPNFGQVQQPNLAQFQQLGQVQQPNLDQFRPKFGEFNQPDLNEFPQPNYAQLQQAGLDQYQPPNVAPFQSSALNFNFGKRQKRSNHETDFYIRITGVFTCKGKGFQGTAKLWSDSNIFKHDLLQTPKFGPFGMIDATVRDVLNETNPSPKVYLTFDYECDHCKGTYVTPACNIVAANREPSYAFATRCFLGQHELLNACFGDNMNIGGK